MSKQWRRSRTQRFRLPIHGRPRGGGRSRRRRRGGPRSGRRQEHPDRQAGGAGGHHRPRQVPQDLQGGAAAGGAGQGRQAAAGRAAHRPRTRWSSSRCTRSASTAAPGARGFTGPGDWLERHPLLLGPDNLLFWDYTGDKVDARTSPRAGRFRTAARRSSFTLRRGMKWSRRRAVHRRRLRVLVRGHLPEQGPDPDAVGRPGRSTASRARSRRSTTYTVRFKFPEPYYLLRRRPGRLHRPRRPGVQRRRGAHGRRTRRPTT